ncbi:MAG: TrmH family RNA methyltransferase [Pyrinomonadaceae bacterium]
MLKISSRDNPKIKFARQVRDGKETGFIFLEGLRLAEEVLRARLKIREIFHTQNFAESERGQKFLEINQTISTEVSEKIFASIADTKNSQGIIIIAEKPSSGKKQIETNLQKTEFPLALLLHEINNPANLGAILRTAEAVSIAGIITTKNSADAFSPKALRAAMGASLRLCIWTNADFFEVLDWARAKNLKSICADVRSAKSYAEIDWRVGRLLIFGSEARGLSATERAATDESLIIPMENGVESLNLAVACGVILFEARRQREMEN